MSKIFIIIENGIVKDSLLFNNDEEMIEYLGTESRYEIVENDPEKYGIAYAGASWDGQKFTPAPEPEPIPESLIEEVTPLQTIEAPTE